MKTNKKIKIDIIKQLDKFTEDNKDLLLELSNSPQCPTVCVSKNEGGNAQWVHNQPHRSGEMEQLDADGSSATKSKRGWGKPYGY